MRFKPSRLSTSSTFGGNESGTDDTAFNAFGLINTGLAFAPDVSNVLIGRVGVSSFPLVESKLFSKLQVGIDGRFPLLSGDVMLWLENDDSWIDGNPPGDGGIFVGFLPATPPLQFTPSLAVNGVGLRVGKSSGPLLDVGLTLESIALHVFARIAFELEPLRAGASDSEGAA